MKTLFYLGVLLFILFEVANVFFIMPLPGSQEIQSIDIAYFLHSKRWMFRGLFILFLLVGISSAWKGAKWLVILLLLITGGIAYMTQFQMAADTMFYQPKYVLFKSLEGNEVEMDRLILGIEHNGEAKAYPIQYLGYHHQVRDSIGGKPIMVTYCTVCRTGRVFEPVVNGQVENFRLVGMDQFNAMFEDETTKSWWRQVTGEAVAGSLKGQRLPEISATQSSLETWMTMHPNSLIMQPDTNFTDIYAEMSDFETGKRSGKLTRHDTASWQDKSWIAGITLGDSSKAYDWNELVSKGIINDLVSNVPVSIMVTKDQKSLFAFIRSSQTQQLSFRGDTLTDGTMDFNLLGQATDTSYSDLKILPVYQEYWHSWRTFHPGTKK